MRQHLVVLGEPVRVELLDGAADQPVEIAPPLHEQRFVGDVLGQGVLEHVRQLGVQVALEDELERGQLAEELGTALSDLGEAIHQAARELTPDHGGELQRPLGGLGEAVDAGGDDVVDRPGHRERGEGTGEDQVPPVPAQDAALLQRLGQLLDVEGVALGLGADHRPQRLGKIVGGENRGGHPRAVVRGEGGGQRPE